MLDVIEVLETLVDDADVVAPQRHGLEVEEHPLVEPGDVLDRYEVQERKRERLNGLREGHVFQTYPCPVIRVRLAPVKVQQAPREPQADACIGQPVRLTTLDPPTRQEPKNRTATQVPRDPPANLHRPRVRVGSLQKNSVSHCPSDPCTPLEGDTGLDGVGDLLG